MKNFICIFDCESIPDADLIRQSEFGMIKKNQKLSDEALSLAFMKEYEKDQGTSFLPLPYHKIVCICAVLADEFGNFIKVAKMNGDSEASIIQAFFDVINKSKPRLVSFNGRGYDMPLLILRGLKYNINAKAYLDTKDKWNNYQSRYAKEKHLDLFDTLSSFGQRGCRLDLLCKMVGFPGKYDVSGDDVMRLYYEKKLDKIVEYCESDVLNTYLLFLKYELIHAHLCLNDYKECLSSLHAYLHEDPVERSYTEVFIASIEAELNKLA